MPVDLDPPGQVWVCPRCPMTLQTKRTGTRTPMHECAGHGGLRLPMMAEGERGDLRLVEREDYVRDEDVPHADGRPVMRAEVEHPDGRIDVWVYAPTAHAGGKAS